MTPDQIRQIAKEYAASVIDPMPIGNHLPEIFTISKESAKKSFVEMYLPFLEFLTERYCMVERSKVVEMYECFAQNIQASRKLGLTHAEDIAKGSCATMRDLFGSETFNKKEDE